MDGQRLSSSGSEQRQVAGSYKPRNDPPSYVKLE